MSGSDYERELKKILMGDEEEIDSVCRTLSDSVETSYKKMVGNPFLVVRGAGSLGIDLIVMGYGFYFALEVKSSGDEVIHFSDDERLGEQADELVELSREREVPVFYPQRLKTQKHRERWVIHRVDTDISDVEGVEIPVIGRTVHGNRKLEFEGGLPLSRFIDGIVQRLRLRDEVSEPDMLCMECNEREIAVYNPELGYVCKECFKEYVEELEEKKEE